MINKINNGGSSLSKTQNILFVGMLLVCMGPYLGYLGFIFIIVSVFFDKVPIKKYVSFLTTFFILSIGMVHGCFVSAQINVFSFIVCILTLLILFLANNNTLLLLSTKIVKAIAYTVPVALLIAMLQTVGLYPFEFRGNEVLGLMRLTFLFAEPSHYSMILALTSLISLIQSTKLHLRCLLLGGLIFTWSLSGFCIFGFGYIGYKCHQRGFIKCFFLTLILNAIALYLWFFWLENSSFWLASKIESVIQFFSGENVGASSAMLRYNSLILGPYFIMEQLRSGSEWYALLGAGFGNLSTWVEYYYESNYSLSGITDANNIVSNVLISTGVIGFVCYLFACCFFSGLNLKRFFLSTVMLLVLSLFSGYAFGSFAVITLLLTRIYILMVTGYDRLAKY